MVWMKKKNSKLGIDDHRVKLKANQKENMLIRGNFMLE